MPNIHLIRSESISDEFYDEVVCLLNQFPGPMKFLSDDQYVEFLEKEVMERFITREEFYEQSYASIELNEYSRVVFDDDYLPEISWDLIFNKCKHYRREKKVPENDAVILLTDIRNDKNWFSAADPDGDNNFFIHVDEWEYYTHAEPRFPVAFLIATAILHKKMFVDYKTLAAHVHHEARGCISDFCQNKREITLKLRTADICEDCISIIKEKCISPDLFLQCTRIMEHIRTQLLFRDRFELTQLPSRVVITKKREPISFPDMDHSKLRLSPLEKTIFILFLENPQGIAFNQMAQHRERIQEIYMKVGHDFTLANLKNTMDSLTDPTENRLSEITSRMRTKFVKHVGDDIAEHYTIDGPNGGLKKIKLDRQLVSWEGIEPKIK